MTDTSEENGYSTKENPSPAEKLAEILSSAFETNRRLEDLRSHIEATYEQFSASAETSTAEIRSQVEIANNIIQQIEGLKSALLGAQTLFGEQNQEFTTKAKKNQEEIEEIRAHIERFRGAIEESHQTLAWLIRLSQISRGSVPKPASSQNHFQMITAQLLRA